MELPPCRGHLGVLYLPWDCPPEYPGPCSTSLEDSLANPEDPPQTSGGVLSVGEDAPSPPALQPTGADGGGLSLRVAVSMSSGGRCRAASYHHTVHLQVHLCTICSDCFLGLTNSPSVWALGTMYVGPSPGDCPLLSVKMPFVTTPSAAHSHLLLCARLCVHLNCTHPV